MAGQAKAGANPESFQDALGDIFMAIANAKLSPDADLGFLNKVEMVVMGRLKHAARATGRSAATRIARCRGRCAPGTASWWCPPGSRWHRPKVVRILTPQSPLQTWTPLDRRSPRPQDRK